MRNAAMILGIIGGILGMILSSLVIIVGIVMKYAGAIIPNEAEIPLNIQRLLPLFGNMAVGRGVGALVFSIIGLIAATIVRKKYQIGGIVLLIAGIAGFIFLLIGFIVPGILFIIGGILSLVSKESVPE